MTRRRVVILGAAGRDFAYSDVSHGHVMRLGSLALATGADFLLLGPERTMLRAGVPVVAVSAVRTGCGVCDPPRTCQSSS